MASYVFYPGNGTQTDWAVPFPYLSKDHVKVSSAGVTRTFTWVNSALIRVTPAVAAGQVLLVQRVTQKTPMTVFENTNNLTAENLTLAETQSLFIAEEANDRASMSIILDETTGHYNFNSRRATNVADPANDQDAVTKRWAETGMTSQLAQAISQKDQAVAARTAAEAARDVATAKATSATTDAATVATDKATVAADKAIVAADKATVAADKTTVAGYKSETAADRVQTAADRVATGQDRTTVASDKATVAADKTTTSGYKTDAQSARDAAIAARIAAEAARDEAEEIVGGVPSASSIPVTPVGGIQSTNVQAAIAELDTEKARVSSLATVATSGAYSDLTDRPTLGDVAAKGIATAANIRANSGSDALTTDQAWSAAGWVNAGNSGSGTLALNCANGSRFRGVLTGNVTLSFTNPKDGQTVEVILSQDGTGSRTLAYASNIRWPNATAPTISSTANSIAVVISATYCSALDVWIAAGWKVTA